MREVLIIGSGIAGMSSAIALAEQGIRSILVSPFSSERAQSVMAAGGINAVLGADGAAGADGNNESASAMSAPGSQVGMAGDSIACHIEDTLKGGHYLAGEKAVAGLCNAAPSIIRWLESLGTVFTRDDAGAIDRRAFGGQTYKRTCYCGASTGKQIVTALVMETRRYEAAGLIERRLWMDFHSGLIADGKCYGALLYNEQTRGLDPVYADAVIMATGGQNALFGKTTGSTQCDGYAAGRLFQQGAELKNLEFIQYHPTTILTAQKRMLISEAARGEGGRLYYEKDGERVYFMEDAFGEKGNLMPRDVVSRCMYEVPSQVYLDVTFLGKEKIQSRIPEVADLCQKYLDIDIAKEPIPVAPSVHFFMGGLAVDEHHETNIENLYAVGECASRYHGANRLGGNSLLAACYSGKVAAAAIGEKSGSAAGAAGDELRDVQVAGEGEPGQQAGAPDFADYIKREQTIIEEGLAGASPFPVMYIRDLVAETMQRELGIVREEEALKKGIEDVEYYMDVAEKIHYDSSVLPYFNYSVQGILALAKATLVCAEARKESRGAHYRSDYPDTDEAMRKATLIAYEDGAYRVHYDEEGRYED